MENPHKEKPLSCSAFSSLVNEQLFATAPKTDVWILIEHPSPPGQKALEESSIPEDVKAYLLNCQKIIPASRVLLIRQNKPLLNNELMVFIGITTIEPPRLYAYHLTNYLDLVELDIPLLASGTKQDDKHLYKEPLFLICTNSKRDPCCAQWGSAVFNAVTKFAGDQVWQTSHVGGHRFAANLICLPHGIYCGRVRPDSAIDLIKSYQRRTIDMEFYRGRANYPPEVQAAEYFLGQQSVPYNIDAFLLTENRRGAENQWIITFRSKVDRNHYEIIVAAKTSDFLNYESCSTPDKRSSRLQYNLEGWSLK